MGYRVILDAGMTAMEVEFPDANCYTFKDGYLTVGDGRTNSIGVFKGDEFGTFRSGKVAGIVHMDK
jgi:hypothetical protein